MFFLSFSLFFSLAFVILLILVDKFHEHIEMHGIIIKQQSLIVDGIVILSNSSHGLKRYIGQDVVQQVNGSVFLIEK